MTEDLSHRATRKARDELRIRGILEGARPFSLGQGDWLQVADLGDVTAYNACSLDLAGKS